MKLIMFAGSKERYHRQNSKSEMSEMHKGYQVVEKLGQIIRNESYASLITADFGVTMHKLPVSFIL